MLKKRTKIERLFALLKERYALENPRLYGVSRYARHIHWVIFTYLCDRLLAQRLGTNAFKAPWNR